MPERRRSSKFSTPACPLAPSPHRQADGPRAQGERFDVRSGIAPLRSHDYGQAGRLTAVGICLTISWRVIFSGIRGDPQSRPKEVNRGGVVW